MLMPPHVVCRVNYKISLCIFVRRFGIIPKSRKTRFMIYDYKVEKLTLVLEEFFLPSKYIYIYMSHTRINKY